MDILCTPRTGRTRFTGLIAATAVEFALTALLVTVPLATTTNTAFAAPLAARQTYGQPHRPDAVDETVLSEQAARVIRHVLRSGEARTFLVLDKNRAKIIVVENGRVMLTAPALTGKSKRDAFPKHAFRKAMDSAPDQERVTPAGRFGVYRIKGQYGLGESLRVVGMDGTDKASGTQWFVGLHKTYTGNKAEQRPKRLASSDPNERRITNGCINVSKASMNAILKIVPSSFGKTLPLFVLPHDETKTGQLFRLEEETPVLPRERTAPTAPPPRPPERRVQTPYHPERPLTNHKGNAVLRSFMDFIKQFTP